MLSPQELAVNLKELTILIGQTTGSSTNTAVCSINQAFSTDDITDLDMNPSCESDATIQTRTTDWAFVTNLFTLSTTSFQSLQVRLVAALSDRLVQQLVITCCDEDNRTLSASSLIKVDLAPDISVNASAALPKVIFPNPAYENIAPCPCDLTSGLCDNNCCCDNECSAVGEIATFSCQPGAFGGNFVADDPKLCGTDQFDKPDWYQFTCVQFVNSPFIGFYYVNNTGSLINVEDETEFNQRRSQNPPAYTFTDGRIDAAEIMRAAGYSNGDAVQVEASNITDKLILPQRSISGQCLRNSIVTYQNNTDASCDVTLTEALCQRGSVLDVDYYLNNGMQIVSGGGTPLISPTITYYCDDSTNYVKTSTTSSSPTASLFPPITSSAPISCVPTPPGPPQFDSGVCNNVVVNVTYLMTWNASVVMSAEVFITVANVTMTDVPTDFTQPPDNVLAQSFRLRFQPATVEGQNVTRTSGNPGYVVGYSVISGVSQDNSTVEESPGLRVWQPEPSGLCAENGTRAPPFGEDLLTGCVVRLAFDNFTDCSNLRTVVEDQQRALVGAASSQTLLVSRFGVPVLTDVTDWVAVTRDGLSDVNTSLITSSTPGQCPEIPAHIRIEFVTSLTGLVNGVAVREIVGSRVSWLRETWQMSCVGSGACSAGSSLVESFSVTSSVTFTPVDAVPQPSPTRAELRDTTSCENDATCWSELLLPLTDVYYVTMPLSVMRAELEMNLAWTLLLILFSLAVALIPAHWNKIGRHIKETFPL
ncbi:tectonic-2-like isoform X2 [Clavelina lepadiformis]|uniref:tectonic-2-like isoform X2 n=1 Tax=Clavelina lepadiformis TaxID=159417 RepID=UPI0040425E9A